MEIVENEKKVKKKKKIIEIRGKRGKRKKVYELCLRNAPGRKKEQRRKKKCNEKVKQGSGRVNKHGRREKEEN